MDNIKEKYIEDIEALRQEGYKYLNGEVNLMHFKHASGGLGIYGQKGGKQFMFRFRIRSGVTNLETLREIAKLANKYKLGGMHITTRQAIQFHGLSIDDVCDLAIEALDLGICSRGVGGNFPRNVAISPLAGVNKSEPFDVTPYGIAGNKYFEERMATYKLPRKLKVSLSNSSCDGAHVTVQDLGFLAVKDDNGADKFRVYLGGGLGQNPKVALTLDELADPKDFMYYLEAMVQLFKAEGNYENRNKARVRYMREKLGDEGFINAYKEHLAKVKAEGGLELNLEAIEVNKKGNKTDVTHPRLFEQKQDGLYSVYVQPTGGQLKIEDLNRMLDNLKDASNVDIRLAMTEGLFFRNLTGDEAVKFLEASEGVGGNTKFEQSVSCIGIPTCQVGLCNSQGNLESILEYFKAKNFTKDVLPRVYISGCQNSCGVHEIGEIGFTGKKMRVDDAVRECFELQMGGSFLIDKARLGKSYGVMVTENIPPFLYELAVAVDKADKKFRKYVDENNEELLAIVDKYIVK